MVYRLFTERKVNYDIEAQVLKREIQGILGIRQLTDVRLLNRYYVENIDADVFEQCVFTVFAERQTDRVTREFDLDCDYSFSVEYLPGQFDQRADSAEQCIQIIGKMRPVVRTAKVYALYGQLSDAQIEKIKTYCINPVECRLASEILPNTLALTVAMPDRVKTIEGFCESAREDNAEFISTYALAMDDDDLEVAKHYFRTIGRQPTVTEIRVIDTYWSDHCRHTTFLTQIDSVEFLDDTIERTYREYLHMREELAIKKPVCLMDLATIVTKSLSREGRLPNLDVSEEINACTCKIKVNTSNGVQDYLLLFKNETHNHPTEIEPFGGAATCIGGAIRDPLSGRAYVYSAMRITGAGNPLSPYDKTMKGKLPQRKIVTGAAAGYSSYGNQIGLSTNLVDEIYHEGYVAKRMEIGAVLGAVPVGNVKRETPVCGDVVILLGGATGRDGCGGATGSSKSHTACSLEVCGSQVQKGNAPEERKLQRLFRNEQASRLIKRCNDFGAGGVCVAVGELAQGLDINLDCVRKKYEGLDGTELAISESQERMAVVVDGQDADTFIALAQKENLSAVIIATVTDDKKMTMRWRGEIIAQLDRYFLDSNGAVKHAKVKVEQTQDYDKDLPTDFTSGYKHLVGDLNVCDRRGLVERFDSTIGTGTVMLPFGGDNQRAPLQAMVNKIPVNDGQTTTCSVMSWAFNPYIAEKSPYHSAYLAVCESVAKLIATGASRDNIYLTLQEYFEKLRSESRWGKPLSALLGAYRAQCDLSCPAIGGKDSMSGTFEQLDVPPTLVSFAVTTAEQSDIITPEFKKNDSHVYLLVPRYGKDRLPNKQSLLSLFDFIISANKQKVLLSARAVTYGGVAEAVFKLCIGNDIGFRYCDNISLNDLFAYRYGAFVVESEQLSTSNDFECILLGNTTRRAYIEQGEARISLKTLYNTYSGVLESVYPVRCDGHEQGKIETLSYDGCEQRKRAHRSVAIKRTTPSVLIPVFCGTNCEYDTVRAFDRAGARCEVLVMRNQDKRSIEQSIDQFALLLSQTNILFLPGGFSGGDEPDGSGKFITAFLRNQRIAEQLMRHIYVKQNLVGGICNGFQALIKLGLLPYGKVTSPQETQPTLTYNNVARHQSRIVTTRVASTLSPWFSKTRVGEIYSVPISHGEGKFVADDATLHELISNGQIATQYVDKTGKATYDIDYNINGSTMAIECITSKDGLIMGKMGHSERWEEGLYKNVKGNYNMPLFEGAVEYFK